jgi:histidinol-phosphate aminotransferase
MLPEQMNVMCSGSDTQHLAKVVDGGHMDERADGVGIIEVVASVSPADHHGVDAVLRGPLDVVRAVANHQHPVGKGMQLGQCMRHDVGFGGPDAVDTGARDHLEMPVEAEVGQDAPRRRLRLRRCHREPHAGRLQVCEQLGDAVEEPVHCPAPGGVVGSIGGDRGIGVLAEAHFAQRVMHRRPDDAACQITLGRHGPDLAECVPKAGHDALRGVGQGAVEVEEHQLRARRDGTAQGFCHDSIVADVYCRAVASQPRAAARYHGDQAAVPGMLDFAVNVRAAGPPSWLVDRLTARLADLGRYPSAADEYRALHAVAARHGRNVDNVALLSGGAEGFALLANLRPRLAALIAPSFTEPEAALAAAGVPFRHVVLAPPFGLADADIPEAADLVVVGNPTNPTSVLHARDEILALRRPGRVVVVDEAFADGIPGEPASLASEPLPDVVVLRSLTKTWALPGLRVGYALAARDVLDRMTARRPHWPLGTLQLEALAACNSPAAVAEAERGAHRLAALRAEMVAGLTSIGMDVIDGCAPFVLFAVPDAELMRKHLDGKGIAVRRCDTFVGLDGEYLRAAVRPHWPVLVDAIAETLR